MKIMKDYERRKLAEKVQEILRSHNIEMTVNGCGCCGSPEVFFQYKGEIIVDNQENFIIE